MSRRLIETIKSPTGDHVAKVYRDAEWQEFRVTFHENGQHLAQADYHTDDAQDAHSTAAHWVAQQEVTQ